jgi:alpha-L-fucosidase
MNNPDTVWFREARFGLFLHWGLYSLGGVHEQDQWRCRIPREKYAERMSRFTGVGFDADAWIDFAESTGAGYLILTAKHHEGFCLWNSDETSFNSSRAPMGRDVIAELAEACQRRSFPLGIYYSVVDWKHPNYPNEGRHHELPPQPADSPDWDTYREYLLKQCEELCTRYGKIHIWWWDMNVPEIVDPSINAAIRKWQPGILINNRGMDEGDFKTPERHFLQDGTEGRQYEGLVEACESVSPQAWCHRPEDALHTRTYLIKSLTEHMAKGGNYLMNLGPKPDGGIPERESSCFADVGKWFTQMKEALTAEPVSNFFEAGPALYTRSENNLYIILTTPPAAEAIELSPLATQPLRATLLNDSSPLVAKVEWLPMRFHKTPSSVLRIHGLPEALPGGCPIMIKLEFTKLDLAQRMASGSREIL